MNKRLRGGATILIVILALVPVPHHRFPGGESAYELRGGTHLLIHQEAEPTDLSQSSERPVERLQAADIDRFWPLAKEWVVAHHSGARITHLGLRHMEVAAESNRAKVFVAVQTQGGASIYELTFQWQGGWRVTAWSVSPQDQQERESEPTPSTEINRGIMWTFRTRPDVHSAGIPTAWVIQAPFSPRQVPEQSE